MSSDDSKKSKQLYKNWNQEKRENISKQKRRSKSVSPKRKSILEDWYIIPEVWIAYEIIYEAYTKHGSHLKIDPTYREAERCV